MNSHAAGNRFGQLLQGAREAKGLRQEDIGRALGVDRSMIGKWENGQIKRPVAPDDVNRLAELLDVPVLQWVIALGYDVRFEGIADEADAVLLEAYQQASDAQREVVRIALGLERLPATSGPGRSLRRLAEMDRQDHQGTQE